MFFFEHVACSVVVVRRHCRHPCRVYFVFDLTLFGPLVGRVLSPSSRFTAIRAGMYVRFSRLLHVSRSWPSGRYTPSGRSHSRLRFTGSFFDERLISLIFRTMFTHCSFVTSAVATLY